MIATCEHGLPADCPLHHRSRARRILDRAFIPILIVLDLAAVVAAGYALIRAAAFIGGCL